MLDAHPVCPVRGGVSGKGAPYGPGSAIDLLSDADNPSSTPADHLIIDLY
jgi:hypothetical protein